MLDGSLTLLVTAKKFSEKNLSFLTPTGVSLVIHCQRLILSIFKKSLAIHLKVLWELIIILTCILMSKDIEHFLIYLFVIHIPFGGNSLFKYFKHFCIVFFLSL